MNRNVAWRTASTLLLLGGLGVTFVWACLFLGGRYQAERARETFQADLDRDTRTSVVVKPVRLAEKAESAPTALPAGAVLGQIEIPRLGIDAMIYEGVDSRVLRSGVGHVPYTALPGEPFGNVGIAAHRDSYFRPLKDIRPDDTVILRTLTGSYEYRVESTEIVKPTKASVLDPVGRSVLTLVTCYPFYYIGSAPKRFIVRAVSVASSSPR